MIPASVRIPVPSEYVFPHGAMCTDVEPQIDFERRGQADDQARDKETGARVWVVRVLDLEESEVPGRGPRSREVKVKIAAEHQPVPPPRVHPALPPLVEFEGLTLTPYVDSRRCGDGCRSRLAWSLRASGLVAPKSLAEIQAQAA